MHHSSFVVGCVFMSGTLDPPPLLSLSFSPSLSLTRLVTQRHGGARYLPGGALYPSRSQLEPIDHNRCRIIY